MDRFMPDVYQKSIFTINYDKLKKEGIKCLLFDLDNTIAPVHCSEVDEKVKQLMERLDEIGFKLIIFSNSKKPRIKPFKDALNIDASASSKKPLKMKYKKVMQLYHFKDTEIACIGDQILTDVLGANRMGFVSILVNPVSTIDLLGTRIINRPIERKILKYFAKKGIFTKGNYYD